jgi:hypothetical protein
LAAGTGYIGRPMPLFEICTYMILIDPRMRLPGRG